MIPRLLNTPPSQGMDGLPPSGFDEVELGFDAVEAAPCSYPADAPLALVSRLLDDDPFL